ncbi:hypothetical protein A2U01_0063786 [Trifolium medium]|uniref:Uncharacterized protein n=1 Tax=Trifolium medium TaxID=97028 RepID=A0A392S1L8_9FABA|nr:hypothetical protein [Trifolium medium]
MIARSIKRMITGPDTYVGHPFVITTLCRLEDVPIWEDMDEIAIAERPLGRVFFQRAVRELQAVQAAAAPPQPVPQQEQHQVPPYIP